MTSGLRPLGVCAVIMAAANSRLIIVGFIIAPLEIDKDLNLFPGQGAFPTSGEKPTSEMCLGSSTGAGNTRQMLRLRLPNYLDLAVVFVETFRECHETEPN